MAGFCNWRKWGKAQLGRVTFTRPMAPPEQNARMSEHEDGVATYHAARRHDSGYMTCGLACGKTTAVSTCDQMQNAACHVSSTVVTWNS